MSSIKDIRITNQGLVIPEGLKGWQLERFNKRNKNIKIEDYETDNN